MATHVSCQIMFNAEPRRRFYWLSCVLFVAPAEMCVNGNMCWPFSLLPGLESRNVWQLERSNDYYALYFAFDTPSEHLFPRNTLLVEGVESFSTACHFTASCELLFVVKIYFRFAYYYSIQTILTCMKIHTHLDSHVYHTELLNTR